MALVEVVMFSVIPSMYPVWARMRKPGGLGHTYIQVLAWALFGAPGASNPTSVAPLVAHPNAEERGMNLVLLSSLRDDGYEFAGYQSTVPTK